MPIQTDLKLNRSNAEQKHKEDAIEAIRFCMHYDQFINGLVYRHQPRGIYGEDLLVVVPEGTSDEECQGALQVFSKSYEIKNYVIRDCPKSWYLIAIILEENLYKYPPLITNKYKMCAPAFSFDTEGKYCYQGPKIKTEVCAIGVQHFGVYEVTNKNLLQEFKSVRGSEAHDQACILAEQLGLPWKSHFSDVFEPGSGLLNTNHSFLKLP